MKSKDQKTQELAQAIINLRLANNDLSGAISAAWSLCNRPLEYDEWHTAYKNLGGEKITNALASIKCAETNTRFLAYLEAGENIEELISSANKLLFPISTERLNEMVQRLIKNEVPAAEIQIMAAAQYANESLSALSRRWLKTARKIALKNGNITIAIKTANLLGNDYSLSEEELEDLLLIHIERMIEETEKEKKEKGNYVLKECKQCLQLINMLPPEKQIYKQLIFGENTK